MAQWVTAWAMAHTGASLFALRMGGRTANACIRCPISGTMVRIALSNFYGSAPVSILGAAVCVKDRVTSLTFDGAAGITVKPGESLRSDGAALDIRGGDTVEVRLYFAEDQITDSGNALLIGRHSPKGDYSRSVPFVSEHSEVWIRQQRPFPLAEPVTILSAVDVYAENAHAVAILGDSNTFGGQYTKPLGDALAAHNIALLNLGISGNRLLRDSGAPAFGGIFGKAARDRGEWDIFAQHGIRTVVLNVGGNDIFQPGTFAADARELCTAEELWQGTADLAIRCREKGYRVFGATLVPFSGAEGYTPEKQKIADAYNRSVRESDLFDAVIDFYALLGDPAHPNAYLPAYDSGDHIHFSAAAGSHAAAQTVSLFL